MNRRLLGYFFALFVPSAALIVGGAVLAYRLQADNQQQSLRLYETTDTDRGEHALLAHLEAYAHDFAHIREMPELLAAVDAPGSGTIAALEREFVAAARSNRDIAKVRWIDETGRERVRVNHDPAGTTVVPPEKLQDKGDRYFVRDIDLLQPGHVYISPLDLNVDDGVVEVPHNPVLRIGAPLFDSSGARRGLVVVNFRATSMINSFKRSIAGMFGHSMLLNPLGQWLQSPVTADEWAFMFDRPESLGSRHPEIWQRLLAEQQGQFQTAEGLWTFATVRPIDVFDVGPATVASDSVKPHGHAGLAAGPAEFWKIVAVIPQDQIDTLLQPWMRILTRYGAILLLVDLLASYLLARAWVRREDAALQLIRRDAEESATSLRLVLQSNPNAMLIVDHAGTIFEANPRAAEVFGYGTGEMRGVSVDELVPDAARSTHAGRRKSFAANPHARPMGAGLDLAARHRDGREFPVEISLAPLPLRGESFVVVTAVDISARKRAEGQVLELNATLERRVAARTVELIQAEANVRLILDSSADGMYGVDLDGRITFINRAACRILGCETGHLLGMTAEDLVLHDVSPAHDIADRPLARTLHEGRSLTVDDESYRHASGRAVPVLYATHPMVRDGAIVGAVVSFMDVTERRALDAAREAALRQAERLARARSEFLANMSHEIRTPLNGVLGLAQVGFRESCNLPANQDVFSRILESGRTLLNIVDNVLDFSRIEVGKVQIESMPIDLRALINEVLTPISPLATAKGLLVRVEYAPGAPTHCITDPMRLKQVLLNLLANAVKFTERGEVVLGLARDGEKMRFTVRDTGIGISDEQATRIFTAFEQADTSTTRRFGGTGLGLAISKRIVELMGGEVVLVSRPGAGSSFIVTVPLHEPPADTLPDAVKPALQDSGIRRIERLAGIRILFAEDNPVNQMVVQAMLRPEGAELVTVGDGRLAVERVLQDGGDAFDIVLMDIQMPGMDGYEATRGIHEFEPDLPVIGQTAHVLQEAIQLCKAAGMVTHLPKPIDRHDLVAAIMRFARPRVRVEPETAPATRDALE